MYNVQVWDFETNALVRCYWVTTWTRADRLLGKYKARYTGDRYECWYDCVVF